MGTEPLTRRRSPGYVRAMSDRALHGLGARLRRDFATVGLTEQQDWLLSGVISELEYRRRVERDPWKQCACELCMSPFWD